MTSTPEKSNKHNGHLSLLDDSPLKDTGNRVPREADGQFETLLEQACKWTCQLESIRDDFTLLKVKNAILLDRLVMAGEDIE